MFGDMIGSIHKIENFGESVIIEVVITKNERQSSFVSNLKLGRIALSQRDI
jgi:hypothetical protein